MSTPRGLHHVEIYVSDLERSREFWAWFLELMDYEMYQEWDAGFSMRLDATYIVFVQTEEQHKAPEYHRCRTGLNHLAFWGSSQDHIHHLHEKLVSRGVPLLYEDRYPYAGGPDYFAIFFEDPDRIKVEVVAPPLDKDKAEV